MFQKDLLCQIIAIPLDNMLQDNEKTRDHPDFGDYE